MKCPACNKEVYFGKCEQLIFTGIAERVSSLGQDWHRPCLKCERCKKTLTPGSHCEHQGKPYCENPCYRTLFGPKGYGTVASSHIYK